MAVSDAFIASIERRVTDSERREAERDEDIAVLTSRVQEMVKAFEAMRTALYLAAGTVVAAAITLIILGQHS